MFARSFRASKTFTTFVVSFAVFTDILLQNLVVPVLPYALHTRVGLEDQDDIQRWTSILLAAFGAALMIGCFFFGYVGDIYPSRRTPFIVGLGLLSLATLFFALATSLWALLAARILEGLSTAIVHTVGYTLLTEVVGTEHLGKAMGYTSMALSLGLLLGPVLGGVLYEYCGYFQVYLPAFGLIAMEVILRCMVVENEKKPGLLAPPLPSSTEATPKTPPTHAGVKSPASNSVPTETEPLLPSQGTNQPVSAYKTLLTSPCFLVALTSLFILVGIANGFDSTLTPFVQDAFDMRASQAAVLFLALAIPMLLAPISGWLADRYGPRLPIVAGVTVAIPSLGLLSLITQATAMPLLKMATILAFVGLGFALAIGPLGVEAISLAREMEKQSPGGFGPNGILARAIGLMNAISACGGLVGPLYAGFVRVAGGWKALEMLNGALCASILVLTLMGAGGRRVNEAQSEETEV